MCGVGRGGWGESCQGNHPNSTSLCLWKSIRRGSSYFPGVLGCTPPSKLCKAQCQAGRPGPQPVFCFPAAGLSGSFKDAQLGFSQCSAARGRGHAFCELVREGCHFSNFWEDRSPVSYFFLPTAVLMEMCSVMTMMMTMTGMTTTSRACSMPGAVQCFACMISVICTTSL